MVDCLVHRVTGVPLPPSGTGPPLVVPAVVMIDWSDTRSEKWSTAQLNNNNATWVMEENATGHQLETVLLAAIRSNDDDALAHSILAHVMTGILVVAGVWLTAIPPQNWRIVAPPPPPRPAIAHALHSVWVHLILLHKSLPPLATHALVQLMPSEKQSTILNINQKMMVTTETSTTTGSGQLHPENGNVAVDGPRGWHLNKAPSPVSWTLIRLPLPARSALLSMK